MDGLFVYNILAGLYARLCIVREVIFRYNVTLIYGKIIGNCDRIDALSSTNPNATIIGIAAVVKNKPDNDDIISALKDLKESRMIVFGYSIRQMAIAALDLIGVEKYDGDEKTINAFIESKFLF